MSPVFVSMSSRFHRVFALSAVTLGLLAAACGSTPDNTATAADQAAPAAQGQATAVQAHTGVRVPFLRAVDSLTDLRPDQQQTIANLRTTLAQQAAPVAAARAKLGAEVASEVRAGKIDEGRIQPLVDQVSAARAAMAPAVQQAMNTLHDTLDASQRQALVADVQEKAASWHDKGARREHMHEHMQKMAAELGLTDAQRQTIRANLKAERTANEGAGRAAHAEGKERMQALATAFVADKFDAASLNVGAQQGMAAHFSERMTRFLEAAVPVLTAEQRETLASKIASRTQVVDQPEAEE